MLIDENLNRQILEKIANDTFVTSTASNISKNYKLEKKSFYSEKNDITEEYITYHHVEKLVEGGFIKGIYIVQINGEEYHVVTKQGSVSLTASGKDYLNELKSNSVWKRIGKFILTHFYKIIIGLFVLVLSPILVELLKKYLKIM